MIGFCCALIDDVLEGVGVAEAFQESGGEVRYGEGSGSVRVPDGDRLWGTTRDGNVDELFSGSGDELVDDESACLPLDGSFVLGKVAEGLVFGVLKVLGKLGDLLVLLS